MGYKCKHWVFEILPQGCGFLLADIVVNFKELKKITFKPSQCNLVNIP